MRFVFIFGAAAEHGISAAAVVHAFLNDAIERFGSGVSFKEIMVLKFFVVLFFDESYVTIRLHRHAAVVSVDDEFISTRPHVEIQITESLAVANGDSERGFHIADHKLMGEHLGTHAHTPRERLW